MKEILEALADTLAFWRHPKEERSELSDSTEGFRFQMLFEKDFLPWYGLWAYVFVGCCFDMSFDKLPEWAQAGGFLLMFVIPCFLITAFWFWWVFGSSLKWLINVLGESLMFWRN